MVTNFERQSGLLHFILCSKLLGLVCENFTLVICLDIPEVKVVLTIGKRTGPIGIKNGHGLGLKLQSLVEDIAPYCLGCRP